MLVLPSLYSRCWNEMKLDGVLGRGIVMSLLHAWAHPIHTLMIISIWRVTCLHHLHCIMVESIRKGDYGQVQKQSRNETEDYAVSSYLLKIKLISNFRKYILKKPVKNNDGKQNYVGGIVIHIVLNTCDITLNLWWYLWSLWDLFVQPLFLLTKDIDFSLY